MDLYTKLPQSIKCPVSQEKGSKKKPIREYLTDSLPARYTGFEALEHKAHVLDSVRKKWQKPEKGKGRNRLSVNDRRKLNIFELKAEGLRFEDYLPLHRLWQDYMRSILDLSRYNSTDPNHSKLNNERLLKADFHGCLVVVRKTKCPSLLGLAGIVLMETKNMVKIIAKDNKIKCIPKASCMFSFQLDGFLFTIHGNQFCVSAAQRTKRKFKQKATVEL
ncbi:ribonuclease P protein subunit p29-like [Dreissena polymorpha]|uniref:Ribonuclease P protein subunit p29 n=1 Tax=Dreissena polymorpha TaxID=45954 RepID=A0A9D4R009_DREPO|nr:ribonuclease P protein subunit p29-like [Dreissena polymorpha]XP_052274617.1 ribonuclease P protein subunit p29-like [Dreissena polymorpha]KAH3849884.1 hypothetical protein DPMN_092288 [Dreissena polymorpha]